MKLTGKLTEKELLPETPEIIAKKQLATTILREAIDKIREMGLFVTSCDVTYNQVITEGGVSMVTKEEWKHGVWRA